MARILITSLIFLLCIKAEVNAQSFQYKSLTKEQFKDFRKLENLSFEIQKSGFKLVDALPKAFKKDGSIDYTDFIQRALDVHKVVIFPDFPILISNKGLNLKSNSILYFGDNSEIVLKPSNSASLSVLKLYNVQNVKLYNVKIKGDRQFSVSRKGEWAMGIRVQNSENIQIFSPYIRDCWGDGIYIGQDPKISSRTKNVSIHGGIIDNCRRNAISITSGEDITLTNILMSNTNGTLPMSGLVIEPNSNLDYIKGINLRNLSSFNNAENGYMFSIAKLYGKKAQQISIIGDNLIENYSKNGLNIGGLHWRYLGTFPPKGDITLSNIFLSGNKSPLVIGDNFDKGINVNILQLKVSDSKSNSLRSNIQENNLKNLVKNKANVKVSFVK